ncbi:MAG: gamma-glutamyl-gamma-aminobutyrate hydrolase family protein [Actinomycetota bacterium]|nr:gamma-glutamyl-gamma-aminobutyrate hydrolase family protein [Actinomycetota bacterium]
MTQVLVAIPTYHLDEGRVLRWRTGGFGIPEGYVLALRRAGAWPVLVPGPSPDETDDLLAPFSGLLLAGGGDVDPGRYGAQPHPRTYGIDADRDDIELSLVSAALRLGLPILAICRGMHVVNVACGGTLEQHLPGVQGRDAHGDPTAHRSVIHSVEVAADSRLGAVLGNRRLDGCVSHHHQAVERIGSNLVPVAWSGDGLVEALEPPPSEPWLVAVQWHPEASAAEDSAQQEIFNGFARRVREHADATGPARGRRGTTSPR